MSVQKCQHGWVEYTPTFVLVLCAAPFILSHQPNLLASHHEVVRDLVRYDRVLPVTRVGRHEVPEPCRRGHNLPGSALPQVLKIPARNKKLEKKQTNKKETNKEKERKRKKKQQKIGKRNK